MLTPGTPASGLERKARKEACGTAIHKIAVVDNYQMLAYKRFTLEGMIPIWDGESLVIESWSPPPSAPSDNPDAWYDLSEMDNHLTNYRRT